MGVGDVPAHVAAARHARDVGPELDDHVGTVHHIVGDIVASAGQWHTLLCEHPLDERDLARVRARLAKKGWPLDFPEPL